MSSAKKNPTGPAYLHPDGRLAVAAYPYDRVVSYRVSLEPWDGPAPEKRIEVLSDVVAITVDRRASPLSFALAGFGASGMIAGLGYLIWWLL